MYYMYTHVVYKHMTNQCMNQKWIKRLKNKKREQAVNLKCIQL